MRVWPVLLPLALGACDRAPDPAPGVVFADAVIALPDDPVDLPPGPGKQAVAENCTACHSPSTMFQQPSISREKWLSIVGKMIEVYKAPVDKAAIPDIVDYLVAVQERQAAEAGAPATNP